MPGGREGLPAIGEPGLALLPLYDGRAHAGLLGAPLLRVQDVRVPQVPHRARARRRRGRLRARRGGVQQGGGVADARHARGRRPPVRKTGRRHQRAGGGEAHPADVRDGPRLRAVRDTQDGMVDFSTHRPLGCVYDRTCPERILTNPAALIGLAFPLYNSFVTYL
jgi:hypothetical protein